MLTLMTCLLITSSLYLISQFSKKYLMNKEKLLSFECGFNPISNPRISFSIQFFKILLIFLLFDMEIILIMPFPLFQPTTLLTYKMFLLIMNFIILSLFFEWKEGALEWIKYIL